MKNIMRGLVISASLLTVGQSFAAQKGGNEAKASNSPKAGHKSVYDSLEKVVKHALSGEHKDGIKACLAHTVDGATDAIHFIDDAGDLIVSYVMDNNGKWSRPAKKVGKVAEDANKNIVKHDLVDSKFVGLDFPVKLEDPIEPHGPAQPAGTWSDSFAKLGGWVNYPGAKAQEYLAAGVKKFIGKGKIFSGSKHAYTAYSISALVYSGLVAGAVKFYNSQTDSEDDTDNLEPEVFAADQDQVGEQATA